MHASTVCSVFQTLFSGRYPKLDQIVNAVGLTIWSMLIGLATWSMMVGGLGGGIDMPPGGLSSERLTQQGQALSASQGWLRQSFEHSGAPRCPFVVQSVSR